MGNPSRQTILWFWFLMVIIPVALAVASLCVAISVYRHPPVTMEIYHEVIGRNDPRYPYYRWIFVAIFTFAAVICVVGAWISARTYRRAMRCVNSAKGDVE